MELVRARNQVAYGSGEFKQDNDVMSVPLVGTDKWSARVWSPWLDATDEQSGFQVVVYLAEILLTLTVAAILHLEIGI